MSFYSASTKRPSSNTILGENTIPLGYTRSMASSSSTRLLVLNGTVTTPALAAPTKPAALSVVFERPSRNINFSPGHQPYSTKP